MTTRTSTASRARASSSSAAFRYYPGEVTYLVENFRSTQHIISAANHVIQRAADRMKVDHPIRIDRQRSKAPPGGRWAVLDAGSGGNVRLVTAPAEANLQAQVVFDEIARLRRLDSAVMPGDIAVLARTHRSLEPLRALCEVEGLPCQLLTREAARSQLPLMQSREGWRMTDLLRSRRCDLVSVVALRRWLSRQVRREPANPYWQDLAAATGELAEAVSDARLPSAEVMDALHEAAREARQGGQAGALKLMTAHGAKGLEFPHVIVMDCADWRWSGEDERRLLYVAMTRARETLTVMRAEGGRNPYLVDLGTVDGVSDLLPARRPEWRSDIDHRYVTLGPADVDIGFAGRFGPEAGGHRRIAALLPGDSVVVEGRQVKTHEGNVVGRLANKTKLPEEGITSATVSGILVRRREQTSPEHLDTLKVDRWETVLLELVVPGARHK